MNQAVKLVVLIEVQPGKSEEQVKLYEKILPQVLNEEGCLEYELHRVSGSDVQFVLTERWSSEEALAAHHTTPHMLEAGSISPSFRAGPATLLKLDSL